jgi:hypothetical protein
LFVPEPINNRLWHIPFNRVNDKLTEDLVRGREDIFFGYEFAIQSGKQLPDDALLSGTTSVSSLTPKPCAAASRFIARGTPPSHRMNTLLIRDRDSKFTGIFDAVFAFASDVAICLVG